MQTSKWVCLKWSASVFIYVGISFAVLYFISAAHSSDSLAAGTPTPIPRVPVFPDRMPLSETKSHGDSKDGAQPIKYAVTEKNYLGASVPAMQHRMSSISH